MNASAPGSAREHLVADLLDRLAARGHTVGCAESLTGGLLVAALIDPPGASRAVRGGVVSYAPDVKTQLLGVDPALVAERGTVDPQVALAMARAVCRVLGTDWGLATTGVAGPDPLDGKAPGTAYVALARPGRGTRVRWLRVGGDRAAVREAAVGEALDMFATALSSPTDPGRQRVG